MWLWLGSRGRGWLWVAGWHWSWVAGIAGIRAGRALTALPQGDVPLYFKLGARAQYVDCSLPVESVPGQEEGAQQGQHRSRSL